MYLNHLQQDEIFIPSAIKSFESITGIKSRRGLENVIVSNGKIVNVVSKSYGHIPNELFFHKAEQLLVDANLKYRKRTINRNDRSFVMDFIIDNDNLFELKNKQDLSIIRGLYLYGHPGSGKTTFIENLLIPEIGPTVMSSVQGVSNVIDTDHFL